MPCLFAMYHTSCAHRGHGLGWCRRLLRREAPARGGSGDDGRSGPPPRRDPPLRPRDPLRGRGRFGRAPGGGRASRGRRAGGRRPLLRQVVRHRGRGRAALVDPGSGHAGALAPERRGQRRQNRRKARRRPRDAPDLAPVLRDRRGGHRRRPRRRRDPAGRHGRPDPEVGRVHSAREPCLARPGPAAGQTTRARSSARVCRTPRRAPRGADAYRLRRLRGPPAARGGEARLTSPARATWRYLWPYRARYGIGIACLGTATLASLTIPWTVKRAIDALQTDPASAPVGHFVTLIALFAIVNGVARLGSRFAITGGCQRIESDIRGDLYAALQTFPPRFYAAHSTGDLMARATSDITAVRSLVGFGTISLVSTTFAFIGVLGAMLAVDPWLTLWALAPHPVLVILAPRFNLKVNERTHAAQG